MGRLVHFSKLGLLVWISLGLISYANACIGPRPHFRMHYDELIDKSENIYLVSVEPIEQAYFRRNNTDLHKACGEKFCMHEMKVIEVIKGAPAALPAVYNLKRGKVNDFDHHSAEPFWNDWVGRSSGDFEFDCMGAPAHFFKAGETYLFFPDFAADAKAAEVIRSDDDKWLKYVRERVAAADEKASKE